MTKIFLILGVTLFAPFFYTQNQLFIPPAMTGTTFDLNVQTGFTNFYTNPTPTYGINGALLAPTIIVNKGDMVTLNVINNLPVNTTMHWHGLHVSPENDGGPHQNILAGTTWSPSFEILNNAGTFWYHPHGHGKTDLHVSKGLAGMFIIHDDEEEALSLPQSYGVDDFPIIVQSKAFDGLQQISIASHMDTALFVNGTINPFVDLPAQVVRLRLLNGSSMRSYNFGFSNNLTFFQIATDGGLLQQPNELDRILLAPGERTEILIDLGGMSGQNIDLLSFASEMPIGIFGSPGVGIMPDVIHDYEENLLNGSDFKLLAINIVNQSANPITSIPTSLVPYIPFNETDVDVNRTIVFDTLRLLSFDTPNLAEGPFGFNNKTFHMDSINEIVKLNDTEIWTLVNKTHIAHPFHIHDIQFNILEKSGIPPPLSEQGWKDVVLVMPHDSVKFITKFTTFSDEMTPYMYHCHLLHHEDDGMMGSFLVREPGANLDEKKIDSEKMLHPNPASEFIYIPLNEEYNLKMSDTKGTVILEKFSYFDQQVDVSSFDEGIYFISVTTLKQNFTFKFIKN